MAIVYKITNKVNGKMYIGLTTRTLKQRFESHLSAVRQGSKFRFHSAIRKYGVDVWDLEILEESDDITHIRKREEELITEYKTTLPAFGYNAKPGGCGGWIVKPENYEQWKNNNTLSNKAEKNSRFNGITNDDLYLMVKNEAIKLGYIPSQRYMIKTYYPAFPKSFSEYRFDGHYKNLVLKLKEEVNLDFNPYKKTEEHNKNLAYAIKGRKWYTDGINNKQCFSDQIPTGFYEGRTPLKGNKKC